MGKKSITLNELATVIDSLAGITKAGFEVVDKRFERVEKRLTNLEHGQEDIILRLDNVAYRFELVEVQKRLKALEEIVLSKSKRSSRAV